MPEEATYWIRYNSIFVQLRRATLSPLPSSSKMVLCCTFRRYSPASLLLLLFLKSSAFIYRIPFGGPKQEGLSLISALDLSVSSSFLQIRGTRQREIKPIPKTANRSLISSSYTFYMPPKPIKTLSIHNQCGIQFTLFSYSLWLVYIWLL